MYLQGRNFLINEISANPLIMEAVHLEDAPILMALTLVPLELVNWDQLIRLIKLPAQLG